MHIYSFMHDNVQYSFLAESDYNAKIFCIGVTSFIGLTLTDIYVAEANCTIQPEEISIDPLYICTLSDMFFMIETLLPISRADRITYQEVIAECPISEVNKITKDFMRNTSVFDDIETCELCMAMKHWVNGIDACPVKH